MNKAIYTLFHSSKWKVALTLVFTWCCLSLQTATAQDTIKINYTANDTLAVGEEPNLAITVDCDADQLLFTDDGSTHGNYNDDTHARRDTILICPENAGSRVTITFTDFDLAAGDTLHIFDGNIDELYEALLLQAIRLRYQTELDSMAAIAGGNPAGLPVGGLPLGSTIEDLLDYLAANPGLGQELFDDHENSSASGSGTGAGSPFSSLAISRDGVSDAWGGWYTASCDPNVNASGCVTFLFRTDGNRAKGTGWEAWVGCESNSLTFDFADGDIPSDVQLACDDAPYTTALTIRAPYVDACGERLESPNDSLIVTVKNEKGTVVKRAMLSSKNAATDNTLPGIYGVGCYTVSFALYSDSTIVSDLKSFCVKVPSLVCNDEVNTVFGAACQLVITPDMVLEDACDTLSDILDYVVNLRFDGDVIATGTLANPPTISQDSLASAGAGDCSGSIDIEVIRTITAPTTDGICHNEPQVVKCTTKLNYEDNTAPIFGGHVAGRDTIIQADTVGITALIDAPFASDNCGDVRTETTVKSVKDADGNTVDPSDICVYPLEVVVRHYAYDKCDNRSTEVTDTVVILRPYEFTVLGIDSLECNEDDPGYLASGVPKLRVGKYVNGAPDYEGFDTLALDVDTLNYTAGYILRFTDVVIDAGDCGSKVFRTWSAIDWCAGSEGPRVIGTQFIHYFDQSAPMFTYTGADTLEAFATKIDLDLGECTKVITPEAPSAEDGCDSDPTRAMFDVARKNEDSTYTSIGANLTEAGALDCDTFRIGWRVYDDCHTQVVEDTIYRYFILQDVQNPEVICEDEIYVSVSTSAGVVMDAASFYRSKRDNCGDPTVLIRRESVEADAVDGWGPWGPSIIVKCEGVTQDVNHNSFQVEVQVTDKNGRTNTCWVKVTPEDKIAPICDDISDIDDLFCDEFHNGDLGVSTDAVANGGNDNGEFDDTWVELVAGSALAELYADKFGTISCLDNIDCGDITVKEEYQLIEKSCGEIEILRRWSATDWLDADGNAVGNTSQVQTQRITIKSRENWTLTFPRDVTVECRGPNAEGGIPAAATYSDIVRSGACDNFVLNVTADTFRTPGETCMKIIRNYELINWCVANVDDEAQVVANNGVLEQIINNETDTINGKPFDAGVGRFIYSQIIKLDVSDGEIMIQQNNADDITDNDIDTCIVGAGDSDPFGEADVLRAIDGDDHYECDTVRVFSAVATNCLGMELTKFSYIVYVRDAGADFATRVELDRGEENTTGEVNVEPGKTYTIDFTAFDDCGNSATNREEYTFRDCKRPTPFVLNGLAVKLGDNCEVEVWAKDLDDNKTFDNCTPKDELEFRISREILADDIQVILDAPSAITLGSADIGTRIVYIYVVDNSNNYDFVRTTINVDTNPNCLDPEARDGMVAGHIVNPNGENVEQVSVSIAGGMQSDMTTGADGAFLFELNTGADYTVTPTKDMNPLNGVSTFDLVLISKHILGITTFDSPYKYIAADVNKSGTITAFDMVQLRQLILSINTEFSNNDSWRFVDAEYDFSASTTNPAAQDFAEFKNISQLAANMMNIDFVGVKVGDVNGNASANSLLGAESRTTNGTLNFNVTDRLVEAGETVTVDFTSTDIATAQGYQFTMNFAGLDFDGLTEGVASAANFNTNLAKRGMLTTSWNGEATADEVLFSLTFNATSTGLLSELITVSSDLTAAEAYNTDGELLDVNIEFATADVAVDFALGQNIPNPFSGETVIGFNLPTAGAATLTVMDVQGKVLKEIRGDYAKGYNAVTLQAKELTPGVLYYQLESADQVATKKMIIID